MSYWETPSRARRSAFRNRWFAWPVILLCAVVLLVLLTAGCGSFDKATEPFKDAPRGDHNDEPADTFTMPDGFSNFAAKCDGTTRVYVLFKSDKAYGAIAAVADHPKCR